MPSSVVLVICFYIFGSTFKIMIIMSFQLVQVYEYY